MSDAPIRVFVINLALYNDGRLVGDWLDLPTDPSALEPWCREHAAYMSRDAFGAPREELFVSDFELSPEVSRTGFADVLRRDHCGKYLPLRVWNLAAAMFGDINRFDVEVVSLIYGKCGATDVLGFLNVVEQNGDVPYTVYDQGTEGMPAKERLGRTVARQSRLETVLERWTVEDCFDYEAYGDQLSDGRLAGEHGFVDVTPDMPSPDAFTFEELEARHGLLEPEAVPKAR